MQLAELGQLDRAAMRQIFEGTPCTVRFWLGTLKQYHYKLATYYSCQYVYGCI